MNNHPEIADKLMAPGEAVRRFIKKGCQLAVGGFTVTRNPMAVAYEIVRQRVRDIHLVCHSNGQALVLTKLSDKEAAYLFEAIEISGGKGNKQKLNVACMLLILVSFLSVLLEAYRGLWLHGLTYAIALSVIAINVTFVYKQMFRSEKSEMELPQRFLTSLISPGILFVASFCYLFIVFIIGWVLGFGINDRFFNMK